MNDHKNQEEKIAAVAAAADALNEAILQLPEDFMITVELQPGSSGRAIKMNDRWTETPPLVNAMVFYLAGHSKPIETPAGFSNISGILTRRAAS